LSNGDDIVFGEMSFREPVRMRRPDRDPGRACLAYQTPAPYDLPIFLERKPADAIERHALRDTSVELGGILLGKECTDEETGEPFVLVTEALEAKHYENTQASFTYTHESWEQITRERDQHHPDLDIVGWYHTHPDFGVFLSSHDLFIHHHFFAQALQVAYVVDPIRQTRGFFRWKDGQMVQVRGFYLSADRAERLPLARLANELEGYPSNDVGGGSGLSPRLEAELIAMLTRPHAPPAADRAQTAAVFSLLGVLLGSLAVGVLFWLYSLGNSMNAQARALADLAEAQSKAEKTLGDAIDGARVSAKEQALDALLKRVGPADTAESLRGQLTEVIKENQALRTRLVRLETERDALTDSVRQERGRTEKALAASKDDAKKIKELDGSLEERNADIARLERELKQQKVLVEEAGAGRLENRYNLAFWAAVGGWTACLATGIWAFSLLGRVHRDDLGEPDGPYGTPGPTLGSTTVALPNAGAPGAAAGRPESPPHVIE
jgi:proteasome lid subunit RPN8/RPN11